MHLYYNKREQQWFINDRFAPEVDGALAFVDSADGSLPVGQHSWALTEPGNRTVGLSSAGITVSLQT